MDDVIAKALATDRALLAKSEKALKQSIIHPADRRFHRARIIRCNQRIKNFLNR